MVKYKQKCAKCGVNYVLVSSWRDRSPICFDCQKPDLEKEITDPEMKDFFDIPYNLYVDSSFLRNIRVNYIRYGRISDRQKEAFTKACAEFTRTE